MRLNELIFESLSRVAFHYTNTKTALNILNSGAFQLSGALGSIEQQYAPKGYPYFLSTTRTRQGGYHRSIGQQGALFVLDGNWFNNHYISKPIDYWENRNPSLGHHREHEAEDRVFSKDPTIPIGGVTAVHLYCDITADPEVKAWTRQAMIAAKRQGIPAYYYSDVNAWRNFDTRKQGDISTLTGQERTGGHISRHKGYLVPWIELIQAKTKQQLSKKADSLRYSLQYTYDKENAVSGLNTDLSNARKPSGGADRANAVKIIKFMQQNGLTSVSQFVDALAAKWKDQKVVSEGFNQPYPLKWEKGEHGDYDALARLDDGNYLSIMFNKENNQDNEEAWSVEFYRNNSQEVTGEGDAQRVFATVLTAIQTFIKKYEPNKIIFSASKEVEPGQKAQSRASLYDSLVQRYARSWGFRALRADTGSKVIYELSRIKSAFTEEAGMFSRVMAHETSPEAAKIIRQQGFKRTRTGIFFNVDNQNYSGGGYGGAVVMAEVSGPADLILNLEDDDNLPDDLDEFADGEEIADYARREGYWAWTDGVQFAVLDPSDIRVV
jgi:hypothetical protein